jgi:hypothetical protein
MILFCRCSGLRDLVAVTVYIHNSTALIANKKHSLTVQLGYSQIRRVASSM